VARRRDDGDGPDGSRARLRVVLVDDYEPVRQLLGRLLAHHGCVVVGEAGDGREALDVVEAVECDLVVMDLNMPVIDGIDATKAITECHPAVKVVAFSSAGDPTASRQVIEAGASVHFAKMDIDALVAYIAAEADGDGGRRG
jgi:DNA-binding NarL/FixJ family response regulator